MGTRSTLSVFDGDDKFDIYRHYDGYPQGPHGVVQDVRLAVQNAWTLPRFEAGDFAAAIISTMKKTPGSVYLTRDADRHLDRNYHYDISCRNDEIQIVVHSYSERIGRVIPAWRGTLGEAIDHYDGRPKIEDGSVDDPWAALAVAEMVLADLKSATAKGYLTEAQEMIFTVMDTRRKSKTGWQE